MKIYLTTFASSDLKQSAKRFKKQAEQMGIYDKIFIFSEKDFDDDFKKYVSSLIKKGKSMGYGYFVWQSYFHRIDIYIIFISVVINNFKVELKLRNNFFNFLI